MQNDMETEIMTTPMIMENQMEKKTEHDMEPMIFGGSL